MHVTTVKLVSLVVRVLLQLKEKMSISAVWYTAKKHSRWLEDKHKMKTILCKCHKAGSDHNEVPCRSCVSCHPWAAMLPPRCTAPQSLDKGDPGTSQTDQPTSLTSRHSTKPHTTDAKPRDGTFACERQGVWGRGGTDVLIKRTSAVSYSSSRSHESVRTRWKLWHTPQHRRTLSGSHVLGHFTHKWRFVQFYTQSQGHLDSAYKAWQFYGLQDDSFCCAWSCHTIIWL